MRVIKIEGGRIVASEGFLEALRKLRFTVVEGRGVEIKVGGSLVTNYSTYYYNKGDIVVRTTDRGSGDILIQIDDIKKGNKTERTPVGDLV
ncbi:hypothetical protein [Thermoproteus tenax]|nr:hypothetical protein [Thermoproteus tenax]